ncbi:MAG: SDR family oxidoreductase [Alphaproteobacteria bacterium]
MDIGISGRTALVCAASKGLGKACAQALAREGAAVVIVARTPEPLRAAAAEIAAETGADVQAVAADIATAEGRALALAACPAPDILVNNCGGPPAGDFRDWERADWIAALDANMLAPIEMIKATVDSMIARRFGRIVNITSMSVKLPIPALGLSNGARAGLTGFVAGLARQTVAHNVTVNNLLPGPFATDRLRENIRAVARMTNRGEDEEEAARLAAVPAGRFGLPAEFGDACAYLCSAQAGFVTGHNLLIDGGSYNGIL